MQPQGESPQGSFDFDKETSTPLPERVENIVQPTTLSAATQQVEVANQEVLNFAASSSPPQQISGAVIEPGTEKTVDTMSLDELIDAYYKEFHGPPDKNTATEIIKEHLRNPAPVHQSILERIRQDRADDNMYGPR